MQPNKVVGSAGNLRDNPSFTNLTARTQYRIFPSDEFKNGEILLSINDGNDESSHNSMGYSWFESMNRGDTMEMFVTSNNMFADAENLFRFNGISVVSRVIRAIISEKPAISTFFVLD